MSKINLTRLSLPLKEALGDRRIAILTDLHGNDIELPLVLLRKAEPDLILIAGDLMDDAGLADPLSSGYALLRGASEIAPTYYSVGNHEIACYHRGNPWRHPTPIPISSEARDCIARTGAILLDNEAVTVDGLHICGLSSGINKKKNEPNGEVLASFASMKGPKILLCHHPEYYEKYLSHLDFDLIVSGHAHGGHWRLFGRGVYAPGQGLFPRYTGGVHDGRWIISRGAGNHTFIPRIFNTPEIIVLETGGK